ncbi:hypothetical protein H072_6654 [Dactylellina haptotyla CBS 200.50]|uniref:Uncharacterized protein n=1 Tax=Dactylellina haptotyla (strain CBS 200.50) TaxID=1284197 RepID=S8BJL0_DACHA|nr:hypothetical protein H072_6654 [Dactylellina haptotyla CBS 200.50]
MRAHAKVRFKEPSREKEDVEKDSESSTEPSSPVSPPSTRPERAFTRVKLLIGPNRTEFDVQADLLDEYSAVFWEHPEGRQFTFPKLSPNAVRIALAALGGYYSGHGSYGSLDTEALHNCFDVYHCAHEWRVPILKRYIYSTLSAYNLLSHMTDYQRFLDQLYQLLGKYYDDKIARQAIAICLDNIRAEHDKLNPALLPLRTQAYGNDMDMKSIRYDQLMTEINRVKGECDCRFCLDQRKRASNRQDRAIWASSNVVRFEVGRVLSLICKTTGFLMKMFSMQMLIVLAMAFVLMGNEIFFDGIADTLNIIVAVYIYIGVLLVGAVFSGYLYVISRCVMRMLERRNSYFARLWLKVVSFPISRRQFWKVFWLAIFAVWSVYFLVSSDLLLPLRLKYSQITWPQLPTFKSNDIWGLINHFSEIFIPSFKLKPFKVKTLWGVKKTWF